MAISVASNGIVTLNNTAPATVSTQDLIDDTSVFTPAANTLDATNRVVSIAGLVIQNGATLIADDEEGTLVIEGTTSLVAGGTLNIGRLTDDFEGTGVAKQTDGLAIKFGGTWTAAGTTNWYAGASWQGTDAHQFNNGSNTNFFGGSWLIGDASITSGTSRFRINSGSTQTFNGNIAGDPNQGIFTIRGRSRMDIFAGSTQTFTNNGGFTADYTPAAAFQVVQGNALFEFFGIGSRGLPNNFVCDAFGDAQLKIRNPGTAGARYNITHQGATLANSYSFMTQDYNPIAFDSNGMVIQNAFLYVIDNVGEAGGTDQADRRITGPATMLWNNANNTDPVFGGSPNNRYNGNIVYEGLTGADGRVINAGNNRVTGAADATGRGHEIVTRLLIGGQSPGGVFTDSNANQGGVATNYRWTTDNNDTAAMRWSAYGKLRTNTNVNLIGTGAPINDNPVLADDPVVDAINRTAAQANTAFTNGGVASSNDLIAVIEHYQTPQTGTDNASLFRFSDTTAEKAWTGITGGAVVFPNRVIALVQTGTGVSYDGPSNAITVNGVNTAFTESAVNLDLGSGDFFIDRPVSSYAGMAVTTTGNISLERDGNTSNITLTGSDIDLTSWTGSFTSGAMLTGNITGLNLTPTVSIGATSTVTYADNAVVNWSNVMLPASGSITIRGNNLTISGVPGDAQNSRVLINQSGDTGSTFAVDVFNYNFESGTLAGRWAVRNVTKGITLVSESVTAGTAQSHPVANNDTANIEVGDTIRIYYKPTNTATEGYATNIIDYIVPAITVNTTVPITAIRLDDLLYVTPAEASYTGASLDVTANSARIVITLTSATATSATRSGAASQNLLLMATDDPDYFSQMVANERTQDYVRPGVNATVVDAVDFASSSGTIQQVLQAVSGSFVINDLTTYTGIPSVSIFDNPLGISTTDVQNAVNSAPSVIQIRRGVGYTIDGIFPSRGNSNGNYSNTGNYGDDL